MATNPSILKTNAFGYTIHLNYLHDTNEDVEYFLDRRIVAERGGCTGSITYALQARYLTFVEHEAGVSAVPSAGWFYSGDRGCLGSAVGMDAAKHFHDVLRMSIGLDGLNSTTDFAAAGSIHHIVDHYNSYGSHQLRGAAGDSTIASDGGITADPTPNVTDRNVGAHLRKVEDIAGFG